MGFQIDRAGLSLSNPSFTPPTKVLGEVNPIESPAARLAEAVARAGWDIPGIEVKARFSDWPAPTRSTISSISFAGEDGGTSTVRFGNTQRDGTYAAISFTFPDGRDVSRYDDGSGSGSPEDFARAAEAIGKAAAELEAMPAADGHDDVTDQGDANFRKLALPAPSPIPLGFPVLHAWAEADDAYTLAHPDPSDRKAMRLSWRLLPLNVKRPDGSNIADHAYNSFVYASPDPAERTAAPGWNVHDDSLPVKISLRDLTDVYVFDGNAELDERDRITERAIAEGRNRFTLEETYAMKLAAAGTLVPASEYDGRYSRPVYAIGRYLGPDEVSLVRGKVAARVDNGAAEAVIETQDHGTLVLWRGVNAAPGQCNHASNLAKRVAQTLGTRAHESEQIMEGARVMYGRFDEVMQPQA